MVVVCVETERMGLGLGQRPCRVQPRDSKVWCEGVSESYIHKDIRIYGRHMLYGGDCRNIVCCTERYRTVQYV